MPPTLDCIMPFYNEQPRIYRMLDMVTQLKQINRIVCVDDGSDQPRLDVSRYPQVRLVTLSENRGKSAAVEAGLRHVTASHVLLFDADLKYLNLAHVSQAIDYYLQHANQLGMLLLFRTGRILVSRLLRFSQVFTGERILSTHDLRQVFQYQPQGFQLEIAINYYMEQKQKPVICYDVESRNTYKVGKYPNKLDAVQADLAQCQEILEFKGWRCVLSQLAFFGRNRVRRAGQPFSFINQSINWQQSLFKKLKESPEKLIRKNS